METENVQTEQAAAPAEQAPVEQTQAAPAEVTQEAQAQPQPEEPTTTEDLYQGGEDEAEASDEPAAPEPVEYNFEGVTSESGEITEQDIASIKSLSEDLKLTNDQARDLLSKSGKYITENLKAKQASMVMGWIKEIRADPALGGANFKTTQSNLNRAIKRYGGDGAFKILTDSGLGAHPAIVKMLNAIGRDLGEEQKFVNSKSQAPKPKNPLRTIYDKSPDLNFGD